MMVVSIMSTCVMFRSCGVFASKNALWATTMMVVSVMSTCVMFRLCGLFDDDDDDDDDGVAVAPPAASFAAVVRWFRSQLHADDDLAWELCYL
jgi:hypothetical protein